MKSPITRFSTVWALIGFALSASGLAVEPAPTRIEVRLPRNAGHHQSLVVEYQPLKSAQASVTLTTRGKQHKDSGFYCQKMSDHLLCSGDDDSGRLIIREKTIEIAFLRLNVAGEKILSYDGKSRPLKFKTLNR